MRRTLLFLAGFMSLSAAAQIPDNLVVEGVPPIPAEIRQKAQPYLEFRSAGFSGWHPVRREMLIRTRFANSPQLHLVQHPGGARKQLTFFPEPVGWGAFYPVSDGYFIFGQDMGGSEFYQIYRFDLTNAQVTLLTDGKSRNMSPQWARDGKWLAHTSTRRNGRDTDVYTVDPLQPDSAKLVKEMTGGGWSILDCSYDNKELLIREYISINESHLHVLTLAASQLRKVSPASKGKVAYGQALFSTNSAVLYVLTDLDSEFQRLCTLDIKTGKIEPLVPGVKWDVEQIALSHDGSLLAYVLNEDGASKLRILDTKTRKEIPAPDLPPGVIGGMEWHKNGQDIAMTIGSATSPGDVYSYNVKTRKVERWTESETGGLNAKAFVNPETIRVKSFDGVEISAMVYRPPNAKNKSPVIISIHGGPESQSRPVYQGRDNYYLNELGIAIVKPNVRGSDGYGKTYLTLDNGFKREDSVRDIGAIIQWIKSQPELDGDRIAVAGGSYGGYMVLASLMHFGDQLRCGVDVVGISNFNTFLKNTQDYRRDLRRAEYGDERDPAMREFLEKISPTTNVKRITKPLFVVQGANDPRVPLTEATQMVEAIRKNGGPVWYLMAKDEGHGFAKKSNSDFQFYSTVLFYQTFLLQ